jgi:hypothetical protein
MQSEKASRKGAQRHAHSREGFSPDITTHCAPSPRGGVGDLRILSCAEKGMSPLPSPGMILTALQCPGKNPEESASVIPGGDDHPNLA